jgi:Carboxypeptidase regulatory-like domain
MTRQHIVVLSFLLAAGARSAAAQTPVAGQVPTAARQPASAIIRGRIAAADSGKPLRRVRVSLVVAGANVPPIVVSTNTQGRFEMKNVAAGLYRVSATRAGYLTVQYGQRRPREEGSTVQVDDGQVLEHIDFALPRGGVFAGRITDESGEPYPGVRVEALELRYRGGRRVPFPTGGATTDDLGQFRIGGLPPGTYYLGATSSETWLGPAKDTYGYAYTYFPGVTAEQVQAMSVTLAQQRTDLDFSLRASRTSRLSGRVLSASGESAQGELVSLLREVGPGLVASSPVASARTARDGTFEIRAVPPGNYVLDTARTSGGRYESASLRLTVAGADIEDVVLAPRSSSTVSGSVITDEGGLPPFPPSRLRILLVPGDEDKVLPTGRLQAVAADGSFRLQGIGGPFLFRLDGLPDGWMLKTVRLGDDDVSEAPFDVPTGGKEINGLQMIVTQKVGKLSGDIVDSAGKPVTDSTVIVFSEDAKLWGPASRFVRTTRPDSDGHFAIVGLPAGRYRAIVRASIEDGQSEDAHFLESLRHDASVVELLEGESTTVTLKTPSQRPQ